MAPLPDNDKAPDKTDKNKEDKDKDTPKESQKDEKTLSNLNDKELKALLDEAINYKNPKDREGKSELFNDLLLEAEETERIARATSAGGSELVRHCNPAARRHRHGGGPRGRRYGGPSSSGLMGRSVSERGTHGGSLDNLAKEELYYEATCRRLRGGRKSSTSSSGASSSYGGNQVRVSARQREGGSLPCNVNSGETSRDFLEEAKRTREMRDKDYTVVDMETEGLLENDLLARGYDERLIDGGGPSRDGPSNPGQPLMVSTSCPKFTSKATLQISNRASNVDDPLPLDLDSAAADKQKIDANTLAKVVHSKYQVIIPTYSTKTTGVDEKKVDENGNALHQTKEKKKKKQSDKNVVVLKSENIEGHKSEIINNVDELLHYIEGTTENLKARPGGGVQSSKSRQLHKQHVSEDGGLKAGGGGGKKRHTKSSGGKEAEAGGEPGEGRHELKKSNSLGEISGMKLDRDFESSFTAASITATTSITTTPTTTTTTKKNKQEKEEENVVLRGGGGGNKPSMTADRARERRSWGTVEAPSSFHQALAAASSLENLETAGGAAGGGGGQQDNWEVTRPKKKSKKRRNSVSSASGARQNSSASGVSSTISNDDRRSRRAPSPDLGVVIVGVSNVKTTRSMPHSEKSNDSSSDVDSVHSLPLDGPISYADIAKNSEKKKPSPEKQDQRPSPPQNKEKSPLSLKCLDNHDSTTKSPPPLVTSPLEKTTPVGSTFAPPVTPSNPPVAVPDVHNIKSFPAITGSLTKTSPSSVISTAPGGHHTTPTSDKAVQSSLVYEENALEKTPPPAQKQTTPVGVATLQQQQPASAEVVLAQSTPLAGGPTNQTPYSGGRRQQNVVGKSKGGKVGVDAAMVTQTSPPVNPVQGFFGAQGDVHGDLAFFAQIMKDPAHYAVQRMPPDIMEVSTIEKMQFMNYSTSPGSVSVSTQSGTPYNSTTQVSYTQTPPGSAGAGNAPPLQQQAPPPKGSTTIKRRKGVATARGVADVERRGDEGDAGDGSSVCDTSLEERGVGGMRMANGLSEETFSSPEPGSQPPASPPAVVILSAGHHSRGEAPLGLIFGFDINEQLLLEDSGGGGDTSSSLVSGQNVSENIITENHIERLPCGGEEWVQRFKPPTNDKGPPKHNHDKIVSFISSAWESVINQKIQYYSDSL